MRSEKGHVREAPIDEFHQHEALHAAHMLTASFDEYVANSKFVSAHPDIEAAAQNAIKAMYEVYQAIGAVDLE